MATEIIDVRKASACGEQVINDVEIRIHGELDTNMSMNDYRNELEADATLIADALANHLPQGVFDRVVVLCMQHIVSDYAVNLRIKA